MDYKELVTESSQELLLEELERTKWKRYWRTIKVDWALYVMILPIIIFFFLIRYLPIGGILVAFKNYIPSLGVQGSDFQGFRYFQILLFNELQSAEFWRAFRNTFSLSLYEMIFGFPIPIILALFFSEIKSDLYRSITQILSYLPKFISSVVITTLIWMMLFGGSANSSPGVLASLFMNLGLVPEGTQMMITAKYFRSIYVVSGIWESAGYGSIVYFAAIMGISPTNYEAARMDGANKLAQIRYVTLPGISATLTIMLILRIGQILTIGFEKVLLLYNTSTYETGDVISTYVIRIGGLLAATNTNIALGAAADLFNAFISMALVLGANFISRRVSETSLF